MSRELSTSRSAQDSVPYLLQSRPVDRRGYPIPFTTSMVDGQPDFRTIDPIKVMACVKDHLCALCGTELGYWIAFIGGPKSIKNRVFADPAMHPKCAEYAADVCPYLVYRDKPRATARPESIAPLGHIAEKPLVFGIGICRGFQLLMTQPAPLIRADAFKRVEWREPKERVVV